MPDPGMGSDARALSCGGSGMKPLETILHFVGTLDDEESFMFLRTLEAFAAARSKAWKTRLLNDFERYYRARHGF